MWKALLLVHVYSLEDRGKVLRTGVPTRLNTVEVQGSTDCDKLVSSHVRVALELVP